MVVSLHQALHGADPHLRSQSGYQAFDYAAAGTSWAPGDQVDRIREVLQEAMEANPPLRTAEDLEEARRRGIRSDMMDRPR